MNIGRLDSAIKLINLNKFISGRFNIPNELRDELLAAFLHTLCKVLSFIWDAEEDRKEVHLLALMLGVLAATQSVVEHGFIHIECDADLFGCSDSLSIEGVPQYLLPAG